MQKNLVKQQKRNWSESKTSQVMDWKGGWPGCRVKALSATLSLPRLPQLWNARLFPSLWSWVPGQTDKEKGTIQTFLGKHNKLVLRKKKQTWFWHLLFTPNCKNVVIGKYRKKRQRKRGNWIKLDKNKLGTHTTCADLVWRKHEAENTYNFGTIYHLSTQINLEYYKLQ